MGEVSDEDAGKEEDEQEECHQQDGSSCDGDVVTNGTKVLLGIEYSGALRNGKREGFGTQKWPNGCRYEGYFHNDTRHGKGKHWWPNGEVRRTLATACRAFCVHLELNATADVESRAALICACSAYHYRSAASSMN